MVQLGHSVIKDIGMEISNHRCVSESVTFGCQISKELFATTDIMWERMKKLCDLPLGFPHKYPTPALDRCLTRLRLWVGEAYQIARDLEAASKSVSKSQCNCAGCERRKCGCQACALRSINCVQDKKVSLKLGDCINAFFLPRLEKRMDKPYCVCVSEDHGHGKR